MALKQFKRSARLAKWMPLCLIFACSIVLAADPIVPSAKLPATTPWDLKNLSEPPAFEWIDASGPVRSLLYEGEPLQGKPTHIFAYFASPETLGKKTEAGQRFPAVVLLHGGGGTAFREWTELWAKRGYAAIAMDLAGYQAVKSTGPSSADNRVRVADGGPDQDEETKFGAIDKAPTEQWTYHAVAAAIRAHSLMRSFPEVDADHTAVTGISWGGYLTSIVAGVDNRFKAAVPVYGCGFLHENSAWLKQFAKMTPQQQERWVKLWDPSAYLPAVEMPIFFVNGTNDFAYPLDSYMKSYDVVPDEKQIRVTVNMPHSHTDGWAPAEIGMFVDQHLRGGRALPSIGQLETVDGKKSLKCQSAGNLTANLHFTKDADDFSGRIWQTSAATIVDDKVSADAVSSDATAWFITITDDRNATVSSEVFFK